MLAKAQEIEQRRQRRGMSARQATGRIRRRVTCQEAATWRRRNTRSIPGCSSQLKASAANYLVSVNSMCKTLDVKLTPIPDWNCCGASIGYAGGSELSRHVMNARNFALAETHLPGQDIVATCAACWLNARESKEKLDGSAQLLADTNEALKEAGLAVQGRSRRCGTWSRC